MAWGEAGACALHAFRRTSAQGAFFPRRRRSIYVELPSNKIHSPTGGPTYSEPQTTGC